MRSARTILTAALFAAAIVLATASQASVTISDAKTKNESCVAGICTPTASNANLNAGDLVAMLAASDITVKSTATAPDIGITDPLTWTSTHRLTLDAYESIHVRVPVVVEGTSGLTLTTNDGGSGGDYTFNSSTSGRIDFWDANSSLIINGQSYKLVNDIKTLASDISADPTGHFALASTFDASVDGTYSVPPLPDLAGSFEGLGNTIENLKIISVTDNSLVGLFGQITQSAIVRDINLSAANISGTGSTTDSPSERVAALAGNSFGTIFAVNVSGTVSGGRHTLAGGLVGYDTGLIENSNFTGTVKGSYAKARHNFFDAGGIAGELERGTILHSFATVQISNGTVVGGLVGGSYDSTIALSKAAGHVSGRLAGGLVGFVYALSAIASVSQSFATANVSHCQVCGGFVGAHLSGSSYTAIISQSYSTGSIRGGTAYQGGFAGQVGGASITQSYAAGSVGSAPCAAGFAGYVNFPIFSISYWDIDTTSRNYGGCDANISGVTGLTDDQLKSALPAGFDPAVWGQDPNINNGWPYLLANPPQ